ncbi:MAG: phytanoyl-CoA dioxygenase family protein [Blastocatellia bacterium]
MPSDLSAIHHPIGDLFSVPERDPEQHRLTKEQIQFFHEYGYLKNIRMLTASQVARLLTELDGLMSAECAQSPLWYEHHFNESANRDQVLFHALGAWRIAPAFHDVLWHPAFLVPAAQLLEGAVRFWHDQLFCKPARHGGVVAWHQDYSYWTRTRPMAHLTCHIALDQATTENGCLQYIPGSHRWDLLPVTGLAGDMNAVQAVLNNEQRGQCKPVAIELEPGECAFHHPLMMHGSFANNSDRARRATVINVFRDGVRSATDDELLAGVAPVAAGAKMEGRFFPLLFDPALS